jgi:hypothetical protein
VEGAAVVVGAVVEVNGRVVAAVVVGATVVGMTVVVVAVEEQAATPSVTISTRHMPARLRAFCIKPPGQKPDC